MNITNQSSAELLMAAALTGEQTVFQVEKASLQIWIV